MLHELTQRQASLEQAFMQLTRDEVEFKAGELDAARQAELETDEFAAEEEEVA